MKFSGRLQIEAEPRNWLKTDLSLSHGRLELVSGGDLLGSWSTAQVKAERVEGDRFQLHLGDERAVFAADDALAFSYEALPVLAKKTVLTAATGLRGKLLKGLAGVERFTQADPLHVNEPEVAPSEPPPDTDGFGAEGEPLDLSETPQPTRKLRDLIQAAVRSSQADSSAVDQGEGSVPDRRSRFTGDHPETGSEDDTHVEPGPAHRLWPEEPGLAAPDPGPTVEVTFESRPAKSAWANIPEPGDDEIPADRAKIDLSAVFVEAGGSYGATERAGPARGLLDPEGTSFENGEFLGERPAAPFGWVRAAEEALPAVAALDVPGPVIRSLDSLIAEVRNSTMTPAQIGAVTDLVRAVAAALAEKR